MLKILKDIATLSGISLKVIHGSSSDRLEPLRSFAYEISVDQGHRFNSTPTILLQLIPSRRGRTADTLLTNDILPMFDDNEYLTNQPMMASSLSATASDRRVRTIVYTSDKSMAVLTSMQDCEQLRTFVVMLYVIHFHTTEPYHSAISEAFIKGTTDIQYSQECMDIFKRAEVNATVDGFFDISRKLNDFSSKINQVKSDISALRERLDILYTNLKTYYAKQFHAHHLTNEEDERRQVTDLLLNSNYIHHIEISANREYFITYIKTFLTFSEDAGNFIRGAHNSERHVLYNRDRLINLIELVDEGMLRIPITACIMSTFSNNAGRLESSGIRRGSKDDPRLSALYSSHIINSHIMDYDCFDEVKINAAEFYNDKNYELFFEVLRAGVSSVNLYDGVVVNDFIRELERLPMDAVLQYRSEKGWGPITKGDLYETL